EPVRPLGRRHELHRKPELPWPVGVPPPLDVHDALRRALPAAQLADARSRLHDLGDEPDRVSPDQPPAARGERAPRVPDDRRARPGRRRSRGPRGVGAVRDPSAARRVGGLGDGAPGRAVRALLPGDRARLPSAGAGEARRPSVARVAGGVGRLPPALVPLDGVGDHAAARAPRARRLPAPPAGAAERCGPALAGEDPLFRPRPRRRGARPARLEPGAGQADAGAARARRARGAGSVRLKGAAVTAALAVAALAGLGVLTFRQTRVWHDSRTLWEHALRVDPDDYVAYLNRGTVRQAEGDLVGAFADFSEAVRRNP